MEHAFSDIPTRQEALRALLEKWAFAADTEYVPLAECLGRVAAEDIHAVQTVPLLRVSAMDGFAVRAAAFAQGTPDVSGWESGRDYVPADTGDDFPDEYDTVIPVEQMHPDAHGRMMLTEGFRFVPGSGVRPGGSIVREGSLLIKKHTRITPELRASLAIGGICMIPVIRRPVVAFIPTGSELVPEGIVPRRGQNVECNSLLLSPYLEQWGARAVCLPIVEDAPARLERALDSALRFADIVVINGGSSKGTEDYNTRLLRHRASYFQHSVRTVPGRPVGIALIDGTPVINLPGPVLAAWVVGDWLLYPMICRWLGLPVVQRQEVCAILTEDFPKGPPVEVYSKVFLEKRGAQYYATPLGRSTQTTEMLLNGNGLLIAPAGSIGYQKGGTCNRAAIPIGLAYQSEAGRTLCFCRKEAVQKQHS